MRGTKAKRLRVLAVDRYQAGDRVSQVANHHGQAMTSPIRHLYQCLKGRRQLNGMMRMG